MHLSRSRKPLLLCVVTFSVMLLLTILTTSPVGAAETVDPAPAPSPKKDAPEKPGVPDYVSPEDQKTIARQWPLIQAAERIRPLVEAGDDSGYAGIELADDRVVVWWKGSPSRRVSAAVAAAASVAPVEVRQADHSEKELRTAAKKLMASAGVTVDGPVHAVKMPFDGSGLTAAVDPQEPSKASARSLVPAGIGVPVNIVTAPRTKLSSRCDDSPPWYGGVAIRNTKFPTLGCGRTSGVYTCTAGFSVRQGNVTYMLTAGHCGANGDTFTDAMGQTIGTGYREHTAHDLMLIYPPGDVAGRMWDGKPSVNDFTKAVKGWVWTHGGQSLCTSGTTSGARCGFTVDGVFTSLCAQDVYGRDECYEDLVSAASPSGPGSAQGDSGGPVFQLDPNDYGNVWAAGTITGTRWIWLLGDWLVFQDFGTATQDWPGLNVIGG